MNDQPISRRNFLKGMGALIAASSIPVITSGCSPEAPAPPIDTQISSVPPYPEVPMAPRTAYDPSVLRTFTPHEARTVEALTARILPGTPDDPGAREAGVVTYIDNALAFSEGYVEKTYRMPPYAEVYEGDTPPPDNGYQVIWVSADEIARYGTQSILSPREIYRMGVIAVDQHARARFGARVIELSEEQQDAIIEDLVNNRAEGFAAFAPVAFFQILRFHTAEGMFSDPAYGGNREMVGWRLIGFPGAQRAYTHQDITTEAPPRPPQSLADLHPFSPGEYAGDNVVLPVSGSREEHPVHHDHP